MIKAIVIDSQVHYLQLIRNYCSKMDSIKLVKEFENQVPALRYLRNYPVDLVFFDLVKPSDAFLKAYKSLPQKPFVILTSNYRELAVEGSGFGAVDYLLKPYTFERFKRSVDKIAGYIESSWSNTAKRSNELFIRANYKMLKVNLDEIKLISALDDYIKIHLVNQKFLVVKMTMQSITERLPKDNFVRIHRSYIVSVDHILSVNKKEVILDGFNIPVSSGYCDALNSFTKE